MIGVGLLSVVSVLATAETRGRDIAADAPRSLDS
jgi:hypothetical protein